MSNIKSDELPFWQGVVVLVVVVAILALEGVVERCTDLRQRLRTEHQDVWAGLSLLTLAGLKFIHLVCQLGEWALPKLEKQAAKRVIDV